MKARYSWILIGILLAVVIAILFGLAAEAYMHLQNSDYLSTIVDAPNSTVQKAIYATMTANPWTKTPTAVLK